MYPPRPKSRIRPSELPYYEQKGVWVVQRKFNGTRTLIHVTPSMTVEAWRPGNLPHEQWSLSSEVAKQILSLKLIGGKEYWFDGELLNNKTSSPDYKNKIIFFDILQAGRYLFGNPNLKGRQDLLYEICGAPTNREPGQGIALEVTPNIWLAETFTSDFVARYRDFISLDEIEGLVLKDPQSKLDNFGGKEYEVSWQIRCRKEHKNYSF